MGVLFAAALTVSGMVAAFACLVRSRRDSTAATAWRLLAVASALQAAWAAALGMHLADARVPASALGDLAHVAAGILVAIGLLKLPHRGDGSRKVAQVALDTGAAALGLGLLVWQLVLPARLNGLTWSESALVLAEATVAIVVGSAIVLVLVRARSSGGLPLRSLAPLVVGEAVHVSGAALAATALAQGLQTATPAVVVAAAGQALVTFAALRPADEVDTEWEIRWRERAAVIAPLLPLVASGVLWVVAVLAGFPVSPVTTTLAIAMLVLLLAGVVMARLDALEISRTLDRRVALRTLDLGTREKWFRTLVQNASDVVCVIDDQGTIRYVSPAVTGMLGHDPATLSGRVLTEFLRPDESRAFSALLSQASYRDGLVDTIAMQLWRADGAWLHTETAVTSLLRDADIRGIVLNIRDVHERRLLQDELSRQAFSDVLTGLANRALFRSRVEAELAQGSPGSVAVLFCDLDGFKGVNDSQGHDVGDELLVLVAQRLRNCVRPGDLVARLGGDEFGMLVTGPDAADAALWAAQRVQRVLSGDFRLGEQSVRIGGSTGIAVNHTGTESAERLLQNADVAMYRAKTSGSSTFVRFEESMHREIVAELKTVEDLRDAVRNNQMVLHYQPVVDLETFSVTGVEALIRWQHPERGLVPPAQFIELAEDKGLVAELGGFALAESLKQAAAWQRFSPDAKPFRVAVNLSAHQVQRELPRQLHDLAAQFQVPLSTLTLEVTETVFMERTEEVEQIMTRLKTLGVRIAVDDFGTGYSSLSYLSRFPVDVLKIDRAFIEHVGCESDRAELARTIVELGRTLQLRTVAEGLENAEQVRLLRAMGCDRGQGYVFARPMPAEALTQLFEENQVDGHPHLAPAGARMGTA